jgi:hypothetical protein
MAPIKRGRHAVEETLVADDAVAGPSHGGVSATPSEHQLLLYCAYALANYFQVLTEPLLEQETAYF